ncbi:unnamed protein product (macronuclear) [Paramecium tetraurelia]|uniref:Uncharacterized protein n=1 Tax=Paramecium tetraurelia TaxID=5888 RepID=A0DMG7_PARTE|nr:uncharacterized protein GSPATT00018452001 [Paramecium tetraurelia]CAK84234.1 unnamed protein product [Paramecium tetraurelia]|eukprot:XP_001451631.1 hypothetical protein (macronuclear) [Paramecium tetraurelia strain d4-2]
MNKIKGIQWIMKNTQLKEGTKSLKFRDVKLEQDQSLSWMEERAQIFENPNYKRQQESHEQDKIQSCSLINVYLKQQSFNKSMLYQILSEKEFIYGLFKEESIKFEDKVEQPQKKQR